MILMGHFRIDQQKIWYRNLKDYKLNNVMLFEKRIVGREVLTLSDPTSKLVIHYDFPVPLRCRETSDTAFVAFVRPLSEPVRRFSSCSTDFSQQIAQAVLFLFLYAFLS
jgi:hypothetical protein